MAASYLMGLGRLPSAEEVQNARADTTFSSLLQARRELLQRDVSERTTTQARAYRDVFGELPSGNVRANVGDSTLYVEHVAKHLALLQQHPERYQQVIHRAYRFVVGRDAYAEEFEYWKKYDVLPYFLLVGCVEDWGRRNQPGLMVTAGTPTVSVNSAYLATLPLTPAIAGEVRESVSLPGPTAVDSAAGGRNLIAPGAQGIVTSGQMHFVAAGGARLEPAVAN